MSETKHVQEDIQAYWLKQPELFAGAYEERGRGLLSGFLARFLRDRLDQIIPLLQVRPGERVIDVGCGSGPYLEALVKMGAQVTGVDYSAEMLRLAKERLARAGIHDVPLIQADARDLSAIAGPFDWVLAVGLLDYVPDTLQVLREFNRLLRAGGRLLATIPKNPSPFFFIRSGPGNWLRRVALDLPPILVAVNRAELEALWTRAGFALQQVAVTQATMWITLSQKTTAQE